LNREVGNKAWSFENGRTSRIGGRGLDVVRYGGAVRGRSVAKAGDLEESIKTWLAQPGPALLDVKVNPMQLVIPPSPFMAPEAVIGMGVYSAKAVLEGKGRDVWEMMVENIP